jgi:hypothetical protein
MHVSICTDAHVGRSIANDTQMVVYRLHTTQAYHPTHTNVSPLHDTCISWHAFVKALMPYLQTHLVKAIFTLYLSEYMQLYGWNMMNQKVHDDTPSAICMSINSYIAVSVSICTDQSTCSEQAHLHTHTLTHTQIRSHTRAGRKRNKHALSRQGAEEARSPRPRTRRGPVSRERTRTFAASSCAYRMRWIDVCERVQSKIR